MSTPPLNPDDVARVTAALVALDWMDFPHALSRQTIGKVLNCSINEATAIWKDLHDRHRIALKSRFDQRVDRKPIHSSWKWVKAETP